MTFRTKIIEVDGDPTVLIPDQLLKDLDWKIGDTVKSILNPIDRQIEISKVEQRKYRSDGKDL